MSRAVGWVPAAATHPWPLRNSTAHSAHLLPARPHGRGGRAVQLLQPVGGAEGVVAREAARQQAEAAVDELLRLERVQACWGAVVVVGGGREVVVVERG